MDDFHRRESLDMHMRQQFFYRLQNFYIIIEIIVRMKRAHDMDFRKAFHSGDCFFYFGDNVFLRQHEAASIALFAGKCA